MPDTILQEWEQQSQLLPADTTPEERDYFQRNWLAQRKAKLAALPKHDRETIVGHIRGIKTTREGQAPATSGMPAVENFTNQALNNPIMNVARAGKRLVTGQEVPVPQVPITPIDTAGGLTYADRYANAPELAPGDLAGQLGRAPGKAVDFAKNVGNFYGTMLSPGVGLQAKGALLAGGVAAAGDPLQLIEAVPTFMGVKAAQVAGPIVATGAVNYAKAFGMQAGQSAIAGAAGEGLGAAVDSAAGQYADTGKVDLAQVAGDTVTEGLVGGAMGGAAHAAGVAGVTQQYNNTVPGSVNPGPNPNLDPTNPLHQAAQSAARDFQHNEVFNATAADPARRFDTSPAAAAAGRRMDELDQEAARASVVPAPYGPGFAAHRPYSAGIPPEMGMPGIGNVVGAPGSIPIAGSAASVGANVAPDTSTHPAFQPDALPIAIQPPARPAPAYPAPLTQDQAAQLQTGFEEAAGQRAGDRAPEPAGPGWMARALGKLTGRKADAPRSGTALDDVADRLAALEAEVEGASTAGPAVSREINLHNVATRQGPEERMTAQAGGERYTNHLPGRPTGGRVNLDQTIPGQGRAPAGRNAPPAAPVPKGPVARPDLGVSRLIDAVGPDTKPTYVTNKPRALMGQNVTGQSVDLTSQSDERLVRAHQVATARPSAHPHLAKKRQEVEDELGKRGYTLADGAWTKNDAPGGELGRFETVPQPKKLKAEPRAAQVLTPDEALHRTMLSKNHQDHLAKLNAPARKKFMDAFKEKWVGAQPYELVDVDLSKLDRRPFNVDEGKVESLMKKPPEDDGNYPIIGANGTASKHEHLILDGNHRVEAALRAGKKTMKAYVARDVAPAVTAGQAAPDAPQNQTAAGIAAGMAALGSGAKEAGQARALELLRKNGYVGFKNTAAADAFRADNPNWTEATVDGEVRFTPPAPAAASTPAERFAAMTDDDLMAALRKAEDGRTRARANADEKTADRMGAIAADARAEQGRRAAKAEEQDANRGSQGGRTEARPRHIEMNEAADADESARSSWMRQMGEFAEKHQGDPAKMDRIEEGFMLASIGDLKGARAIRDELNPGARRPETEAPPRGVSINDEETRIERYTEAIESGVDKLGKKLSGKSIETIEWYMAGAKARLAKLKSESDSESRGGESGDREASAPAPKPQMTEGIQREERIIAHYEALLRSGKDAQGRKLTERGRKNFEDAVASAKERLASLKGEVKPAAERNDAPEVESESGRPSFGRGEVVYWKDSAGKVQRSTVRGDVHPDDDSFTVRDFPLEAGGVSVGRVSNVSRDQLMDEESGQLAWERQNAKREEAPEIGSTRLVVNPRGRDKGTWVVFREKGADGGYDAPLYRVPARRSRLDEDIARLEREVPGESELQASWRQAELDGARWALANVPHLADKPTPPKPPKGGKPAPAPRFDPANLSEDDIDTLLAELDAADEAAATPVDKDGIPQLTMPLLKNPAPKREGDTPKYKVGQAIRVPRPGVPNAYANVTIDEVGWGEGGGSPWVYTVYGNGKHPELPNGGQWRETVVMPPLGDLVVRDLATGREELIEEGQKDRAPEPQSFAEAAREMAAEMEANALRKLDELFGDESLLTGESGELRPGAFEALVELGASKFVQGFTTFTDWADAMREQVGARVADLGDHLDRLWDAARAEARTRLTTLKKQIAEAREAAGGKMDKAPTGQEGTDGTTNGQVREDGARAPAEPPTNAGESTRGGREAGDGSDRAGRAGERDADGAPDGSRDALRPGVGDRQSGNLPRPVAADTNFVFTEDVDPAAGGAKTKLKANMAALRLLKELDEQGRMASADEQAVLAKYVGWGGLPGVFNPDIKDAALRAAGTELTQLLSPEEFAAARRSALNAHYTSKDVIGGIYAALGAAGFTGGRVLEPSMGSGNFFGYMSAEMQGASRLTGVELDGLTGRIAGHLYPQASISVKGFQDMRLPPNHFDLVISNVPFSETAKPRDPVYAPNGELVLHDFFFVKALGLVRPGGVVAFITSSGTMNKVNPKARKLLDGQADLLAVVRLPGNAFKKNAMTEVTTDLIILRKRLPGEAPAGAAWLETGTVDVSGQQLPLNEYFIANPQMMLGEIVDDSIHPGRAALRGDPEANFAKAIPDALAPHLRPGLFAPPTHAGTEDVAADDLTPAASEHREGTFVVDDKGALKYVEGGVLVDPVLPKVAKNVAERVRGLVALRGLTRDLLHIQNNERTTDAQVAAAQARLGEVYDAFVKQYGFINSRTNALSFNQDADWPLVSALENWNAEEKEATKGDFFSKRTVQPYRRTTSAATAKDGLAVALAERGRVDLARIGELTGQDQDSVIAELGDLIYQDPAAGWVTADEYLSGPVRRKLSAAQAAAKADPRFERNVQALAPVVPEDLPIDAIEVKLGAGWVPTDIVTGWAANALGTKMSDLTIRYEPAAALWTVDSKVDRKIDEDAGTEGMPFTKMLDHILNSRETRISVKDDGGSSVFSPELTERARQHKEKAKLHFQKWVKESEATGASIARIYNETFNASRLRTYDGAHLQLPGKNPAITLAPHQQNAVWRVLQDGRALLAHAVGAGKTFALVAAGMELKRTGLAKKPMYVVPNHMIEQWPREFKQLYPGAKILVITKKDLQAGNRKRVQAKIAMGDWDAVFVTHSQFKMIPISPAFKRTVIDKEIARIQQAILALKTADEKGSAGIVKELEKVAERIEAKMDKVGAKKGAEDDLLNFEDLGVDYLMVDEAHNYKNLFYVSKMGRLKGLGNQEGSGGAFDLYLKSRYVQQLNGGGRGLVLATGTPVTNSLVELYTLMRYLVPDELEAAGIDHFDAWANTFGDAVTSVVLKMDGEGRKAETRFAKFFNIPELTTLFRSFADVQTSSMLNLPVPDVKGGGPQAVIAKPSMLLKRYTKRLLQLFESWSGPAEEGKDNPVVFIGLGRVAALSMRLFSDKVKNDPSDKVNLCVGKALDIYKRTTNVDFRDPKTGETVKANGVQMIFLDAKAPTKKSGQVADEVDGAGIEEAVAGLEGEAVEEVQDDQTAIDAAFDVDTGVDTMSQYNPYHDIKAKLVKAGVRADEIAFIHDAANDKQKAELFARVRKGEVRFLLGSTKKMGEGTNVQRLLVGLHHLDGTWTPAGMEQRNGRIIRQGNWNRGVREVEIYTYATEQSFDANVFQLLQTKQTFVDQIMRGDPTVRTAEDLDSAGEQNYSVLAAIASGNPLFREQAENNIKLDALHVARRDHQERTGRARRDLDSIPTIIEQQQANVAEHKDNLSHFETNKPKELQSTINGAEVSGKEAIEKAIEEAIEALPRTKDILGAGRREGVIGEYAGFTIYASRSYYENAQPTEIFLTRGNYRYPMARARFEMQRRADIMADNIEASEKRIEAAKRTLAETFDRAPDIKRLEERQAQIEAVLNANDEGAKAEAEARMKETGDTRTPEEAEADRLVDEIEANRERVRNAKNAKKGKGPAAAVDLPAIQGVTWKPVEKLKAKKLPKDARPLHGSDRRDAWAHDWNTGDLDGQPAYSNGDYVIAGPVPETEALKSKNGYREATHGTSNAGSLFDFKTNNARGGSEVRPAAVMVIDGWSQPRAVFSNGTMVDPKYLGWAWGQYPNATFTNKGGDSAVLMHEGGKVVGYLPHLSPLGPYRGEPGKAEEQGLDAIRARSGGVASALDGLMDSDGNGGRPGAVNVDALLRAVAEGGPAAARAIGKQGLRLMRSEDGFWMPESLQVLLDAIFDRSSLAKHGKPGDARNLPPEAGVRQPYSDVKAGYDLDGIDPRIEKMRTKLNQLQVDGADPKLIARLEAKLAEVRADLIEKQTSLLNTTRWATKAAGRSVPGFDPNTIAGPEIYTGEKYLPDARGINVRRLDTNDDVRDLLKTFMRESDRQVKAVSNNRVVTHAETEAAADAKLASGELTLEDIMNLNPNAPVDAATITAARKVMVTIAEELQAIAREVQAGTATDRDKHDMLRLYELMGHVAPIVEGITKETARALSAHNIQAKSAAGIAREIHGMLDEYGDGNLMRLADLIATFDDPAALAARAPAPIRTDTAMHKLAEYWLMAILSNPATQVRNSVGSGINIAAMLSDTAVAAAIGVARGRDVADRHTFGEVGAMFGALLGSFPDAWRVANGSFEANRPLSGVTQFEQHGEAIKGLKGEIIRMPGRFLMSGDEFFKVIFQRMSLAQQATALAHKRGKTGAAFDAEVAKLLVNPTNAMIDRANEEANYQTFQKRNGPLMGVLARGKRTWPVLTFILPFIKTPGNIIKYAVEHSIAAPMLADVRDKLSTPGPEADLALAKMTTGTILMTMAATAALAGALTGAGPEDREEKRMLLASGWRPYSVRIPLPDGSTAYLPYNQATGAAGVLIGSVADAVEKFRDASDPDKEGEGVGTAIFKAVITMARGNLLEQTFWRGIHEAVDVAYSPERYLQGWVSNMAASFVPNILGKATALGDSKMRDVRGNDILDESVRKIAARLPFASSEVPQRHDMFGRPVERSLASRVSSIVGPTTPSITPADETLSEMVRLGESANKTSKKLGLAGTQIPLSVDERREVEINRGRLFGKYARAFVESDDFRAMSDYEKKLVIDKLRSRTSEAGGKQFVSDHIESVTERAYAELRRGVEQKKEKRY